MLEGGEVVQEAAVAGGGDAADGLGAVVVVSFFDLDHLCFFEYCEMAA